MLLLLLQHIINCNYAGFIYMIKIKHTTIIILTFKILHI